MLLPQLLANGLATGCAMALVALGFGLIYNTTRVFHLAHGAVYVVAAYTFYSSFTVGRLPFVIASGFTIIVAITFGVIIDELVYRPLDARSSSKRAHLLSSLGLYLLVVNVVALIWGNDTKLLRFGVQETSSAGGVILSAAQLAAMTTFAVIFPCLVLWIRRTPWGRRLRAMRDDRELIQVVGISPRSVRWVVFALGSGLAGVAAILFGLDFGINPQVGFSVVVSSAVAVIIGGVGVFEGAAVGALLLAILQNVVVWQTSGRWHEAVTFVILVLFLLFRPKGLLSTRRRVEEVSA